MRRIAVLLMLALVACVAPARSYGAFRGKATATAKDMLSAVQSARLTVDMAQRRRSFATDISVSLGEAEKDADAIAGAFDSVQPPDKRSDKLRSDLDDLLEAATSTLSKLRIAARRTNLAELVDAAKPLGPVAADLQRFVEANE
jgi:hypothetical protein